MATLGSDIAGVFDVDAQLSVASGRTALAEAVLRRWTTPTGALLGSPRYGYDVHGLIGSSELASVAEQKLTEQALAEEEIRDARVTVQFNAQTSELTVTGMLVDSDGPFELTLQASGPELTLAAFIDGVLFITDTV